jgi:flagellar motor protein MotB
VNAYSDALFEVYSRANDLCEKGSQNGWPYCQTETGLRVFPQAAEPHIGGTAQAATSSSAPSAPPRRQARPTWLQTFWPVCVGALVVVSCVLALAWQAHRQAQANVRLQHQDLEIAKTWREAAQQLVQSLTADLRVLNSNQAAIAASQAQIGAGLAELGNTTTKLANLASTQASATRELAAAQTALAQEATNLAASLRQTFQQGLAEAINQNRADTANLASTQASATRDLAAAQNALAQETTNLAVSLRRTFQQGIAEAASQSRADIANLASTQASATLDLAAAQNALAQETTNLAASLRRTFQQGIAEVASQSRADTAKLQTQIAELAASNKALLDRLSGPTNALNLALGLPGVTKQTFGKSTLLTFDDGLFFHGTCFKPDAESRLQAVAKALAEVPMPLRIEVIGYADDDRVFKGWTARFEESLALGRATAVVNYFIELGLFAPKRLAALSGGATNRPFPSDTVQNRAKNRTAVLKVSTVESPTELP